MTKRSWAMSLKHNYVYSQMKENLGKTLVRQITIVILSWKEQTCYTMKWGPKFREFRFSCVYNWFGSFLDKINQYNFKFLSTAAATAQKYCVHTVTVALCCNTRTHIERWISTLLNGSQPLIMNVGLQEFLELTQSIRDPGNKVVHPTEICNYT